MTLHRERVHPTAVDGCYGCKISGTRWGGLARLRADNEGHYTQAELADMGWGQGGRGKLSHSGSIGGGIAFAAMFPKGYKSNSGRDLSRVHVVLNVNTRLDTTPLNNLASAIALEVPVSSVSSKYDIWTGKPLN